MGKQKKQEKKIAALQDDLSDANKHCCFQAAFLCKEVSKWKDVVGAREPRRTKIYLKVSGLSEVVTADLWVWPGLLLKQHLPSLSPPLKYRKRVPQGPKCSHLSGQVTQASHNNTYWNEGEKNRSPAVGKSRAAGGNISGEGQRVRGEAGGKSLTCWEFRQKGGVRPTRRRGNGGDRRGRKRSVRSRGAATTYY